MVRGMDVAGGGQRAVTINNFPGMPGESGPKLILSVFPMEQKLTLVHEGLKDYVLPKAEKGSYVTLLVTDTYAWCRNWAGDANTFYRAPIPASAVADNLISRWCYGLLESTEGLGPGIIVCAGTVPTEDEVAAATAKQEAYFRHLIAQADFLERNDPTKIHDLHRLAAEWMGTGDRVWAKPITHVEMAACPACAEPIRSHAKKCRWCQTDIPAFLAKAAGGGPKKTSVSDKE